jgi:hypothetical protein
VPSLHKEAATLVQSAFVLHWRQTLDAESQKGLLPGHWVSLVHSTQVLVVALQTGFVPLHAGLQL